MKAIQIQWMPRIASAALCLLAMAGCGPSEKQLAARAEATRIDCLDKICTGDVAPPRNELTDDLIKLNGQWFVGPKEHFSAGMNGGGFYWPSRHPMFKGGQFPESGQDFQAIAIEIFLRSNNIPPVPHGYAALMQWQAEGRIVDRKNVRKGLDSMRILKPDGGMPRGTTYVATEIQGLDALPPVASCNHEHPNNGGGAGFLWQPGIWVGVRMNQKHCADWPEIYAEVARVLQLLKKAQP